MPLINVTKNCTLADSFIECKSFWEQTRGMMFRKDVVPLVFVFDKPQKVRLHSFFCPGPIDLIFLSDDWEVLEVFHNWEPKSNYASKYPALFLLELPGGTAWRTKTEVGDVVQVVR